jgi:hypothetical protein
MVFLNGIAQGRGEFCGFEQLESRIFDSLGAIASISDSYILVSARIGRRSML